MRLILFVSICLISIFYISCEESGEGCLDFFGNNYDFNAVSSCDSCCTYPPVNFDFTLIYNDETFNINRDTFFIGDVDTFVLKRLELVFSDFQFIGDVDTYEIRDTLRTSAAKVNDDFVFIKTTSTKGIGRTRFEDTIRTVNFKLGFDQDIVNQLKPFSDLDQSAQIDEALDSLYIEDTGVYLASKMSLQLFDSTRQVELLDPVLNNQFSFEVSIPVDAGVTWTIETQLDVWQLVNGLNSNMTNEEIGDVLSQNLAAAITVQ